MTSLWDSSIQSFQDDSSSQKKKKSISATMKKAIFSAYSSQSNHFNGSVAVNPNRLPGGSGVCDTKLGD